MWKSQKKIVFKTKNKWIDISVTLKSGMVHWPNDPFIKIERTNNMEKGDRYNISHINMGAHSGTHMDAPLHFFRKGVGLDRMPFDAVVGKARVIQIKDKESIKPEELIKHKIRAGEKILFKTINSNRCWKSDIFIKDFVYISRHAADYLADLGICSVGVDYLSVGGYKSGIKIHQTLLKAGIWIIEGLNLIKVKPGLYDLICLPIKILNSDGAPARAVLKLSD